MTEPSDHPSTSPTGRAQRGTAYALANQFLRDHLTRVAVTAGQTILDLDAREPVLMSLHAVYYELIWAGEKTHEFRRRFLAGQAVRWYVYLNAPVSRLGPVIDLGPAVADVPERIAAIAEQAREGNGASVLEYVHDLAQAFAIPIERVVEYPGMSLDQLKAELRAFHPPQGYIKLRNHPELLRVCEKVTAEPPIRELTPRAGSAA